MIINVFFVYKGVVYGRAFQVQDSTALPYLENRECTLGGYMTTIATFYSREGNRNFPVIVYIATNKNEHWLGDAPLQNIAKQIFECSGPNGHNVEYLLRFVFPIYGRSNLSYFIFFFLFLLFSSLSLSLSHTFHFMCHAQISRVYAPLSARSS